MNVSKCRFVLFASPSRIRSVGEVLPCLAIYGDVVERVREFKYLGVWVDESLIWRRHVRVSVAKVSIAPCAASSICAPL